LRGRRPTQARGPQRRISRQTVLYHEDGRAVFRLRSRRLVTSLSSAACPSRQRGPPSCSPSKLCSSTRQLWSDGIRSLAHRVRTQQWLRVASTSPGLCTQGVVTDDCRRSSSGRLCCRRPCLQGSACQPLGTRNPVRQGAPSLHRIAARSHQSGARGRVLAGHASVTPTWKGHAATVCFPPEMSLPQTWPGPSGFHCLHYELWRCRAATHIGA